MDADDWYKLYRESGGSCGTRIDPHYEHIANDIIEQLRQRHARQQPVISREKYNELCSRLVRGGKLSPSDQADWNLGHKRYYEKR